jgi:hypothetical protein
MSGITGATTISNYVTGFVHLFVFEMWLSLVNARAASGQVAAAPPMREMNSRRRMGL